MLEVDQLLAQIQDALRSQRASLLVLELALDPVSEISPNGKHHIERCGRVERPGYYSEKRNAGKLLLVHARDVE